MSTRSEYHENHECEHDVDYCKKCNEVYCVDCEITWVLACTETHIVYSPWYETGTTTVTDTTTYSPETGDDITLTTACSHD